MRRNRSFHTMFRGPQNLDLPRLIPNYGANYVASQVLEAPDFTIC